MASSSYNQTPSSLPSTSLATVWGVFLSFRGKDTRYTFTDHLYKALHRTGIRTFMDDPELRSGEVISDSLIHAITESRTYIVVLSENYASSSWCLDELVEILRCCKKMKRLVVPVFYYIDPYVVRHQIESFKEAFDKHQTRYDAEKLNNWRLTLNEVAKFSGYNISHNLLAIILAFEDTACRDYDGFRYSVKNITSGFIWSDTLCQYLGSGLLIVVVPSSILSIRDGDKIELKSDQKMICGIHLLYKTENTMTSEYFNTTKNIEDERSNHLCSELGSNNRWLSLGRSSTAVNVEEQRSNPSDNDLESIKNWLSLGSSSTSGNVGKQKGYPSKRFKKTESL